MCILRRSNLNTLCCIQQGISIRHLRAYTNLQALRQAGRAAPEQPPDFTPMRSRSLSLPLSSRRRLRCASAASVSVIAGGGALTVGAGAAAVPAAHEQALKRTSLRGLGTRPGPRTLWHSRRLTQGPAPTAHTCRPRAGRARSERARRASHGAAGAAVRGPAACAEVVRQCAPLAAACVRAGDSMLRLSSSVPKDTPLSCWLQKRI